MQIVASVAYIFYKSQWDRAIFKQYYPPWGIRKQYRLFLQERQGCIPVHGNRLICIWGKFYAKRKVRVRDEITSFQHTGRTALRHDMKI